MIQICSAADTCLFVDFRSFCVCCCLMCCRVVVLFDYCFFFVTLTRIHSYLQYAKIYYGKTTQIVLEGWEYDSFIYSRVLTI